MIRRDHPDGDARFSDRGGGSADDPERGDVILHAGLRYEVLAPNGEPVWRWSGTGRILRRIHTKEIGGA